MQRFNFLVSLWLDLSRNKRIQHLKKEHYVNLVVATRWSGAALLPQDLNDELTLIEQRILLFNRK